MTDQTLGAAELPAQAAPKPASAKATQDELASIRLPRAVQATYLDPLRHRPQPGAIKMAELQMRSYSVRNLEVFADFAMRAAYYLKLPVSGPTSLPRITERWTVPRSNFVHKKSQENFERITVRRSIAIYDGHPDTVAAWLAFIKKHQYYGVGLKANVWDFGGLETAQDMDAEAEKISEKLGKQLELTGGRWAAMRKEEKVKRAVLEEPFKAQWGAYEPMGGAQSVPSASTRTATRTVHASASS